MANSWYAYLGGDVTLLSSYRKTSVKPSFKNGTVLCAVYLPVGGDHPASIPGTVLNYIADALATGRAQPVEGKIYVRLR